MSAKGVGTAWSAPNGKNNRTQESARNTVLSPRENLAIPTVLSPRDYLAIPTVLSPRDSLAIPTVLSPRDSLAIPTSPRTAFLSEKEPSPPANSPFTSQVAIKGSPAASLQTNYNQEVLKI